MKKDSNKGEIKVLGINLAKKSFQLHGVDASDKMLLHKKLTRDALDTRVEVLEKKLKKNKNIKVMLVNE